MERRSTRNSSLRDRERSDCLAVRRGTAKGARREESSESTATDETDVSSEGSVSLLGDTSLTVIVNINKNVRVTEKRVSEALTKKNLTPLPDITLTPGQIILTFNKEEDAEKAMGAFDQKMFGKKKNMRYFSSAVLPERNVFLYFELKSLNELKEVHILYQGDENPVIYKDEDHEQNLLSTLNSLKSARTKARLVGVFVCPQSYYILEDLVKSVGESDILHGWTDLISSLRCEEEENDLKFFPRDEKILDKIHGVTVPDGSQTLVLEKLYMSLTNKLKRKVSLQPGTSSFVMFEVEVEDKDKKRVHMLRRGTTNNFLDITIHTEEKRNSKNKKLLNLESGSEKIVKFLRDSNSEAESIILINTKGKESIPALLDILCRGRCWSLIKSFVGGLVHFQDVWDQFTPSEYKQSHRENIDKSLKVSMSSMKRILDYIVSKETEIVQEVHPFFSKWTNEILEESVTKAGYKIFDPAVSWLALKDKLELVKGETVVVDLDIQPNVPRLVEGQFSVESLHPDIQVQTQLASLDNKGTVSVKVRNTSASLLNVPAGAKLGLAELVAAGDDAEQEVSDVDLYLLSSDEEREELKRRLSEGEERKVKKARITLGDCSETELITSLDEFKLRLAAASPGPCLTGTSTPEILKTGDGTDQLLTQLKESLDKSFDIGDDFDVGAAIQEVDFMEEELEEKNPTVSPVNWNVKHQQRHKKQSDFSPREVTGDRPLIQQLQSLSRLLIPIPVPPGLFEHFPSLLSQEHLKPLCETLAKYGMFSSDCLDFELCDFGDKLMFEVPNFEGDELSALRTVVQEFNKSCPSADLERWKSFFAEKYESFRGINDILGDEFDTKTVQAILLHFSPDLDKAAGEEDRPVTKLKHFTDTAEESHADVDLTEDIVETDPELLRREKILHYFDSRAGHGNIHLGVRKAEDDKKIMIVKNDRLQSVPLVGEESPQDEFFLVHVSHQSGCDFALPLSSWDCPDQSLLYSGFIVSYPSSQECHVAVIDHDALKLVVVDQMIMLEESGSLQQGSEVKLIINSNFEPLLVLADPDRRRYDLQDISNWSDGTASFISNTENLPEIQDLITSLRITSLHFRRTLLIKFANPVKLLKAKQIISQKSLGFETNSSKKMSWIEESFSRKNEGQLHRQVLPANLLASRETLERFKLLFYFTETRVELLNKNVIIVAGEKEERVNLVKKTLLFNLKNSDNSNRRASRKEFLEIKSGQEVFLKENEKKSFKLNMRDINVNEYNVHQHPDFDCFKNQLLATVKIDAEKCITLELSNVSARRIEISRDENLILLERKSSSKVVPKKKQVFNLKLIKTVSIAAKSVSFVDVAVVNFKPILNLLSLKIHRHPAFKTENIFVPDNQMRTISQSGELKISLRNRTNSPLELSKGTIVGQIFP